MHVLVNKKEKFHCTIVNATLVWVNSVCTTQKHVSFTCWRTPNSVFFKSFSYPYTFECVYVLVRIPIRTYILCWRLLRMIVYSSWVDYIGQCAPVSRASIYFNRIESNFLVDFCSSLSATSSLSAFEMQLKKNIKCQTIDYCGRSVKCENIISRDCWRSVTFQTVVKKQKPESTTFY